MPVRRRHRLSVDQRHDPSRNAALVVIADTATANLVTASRHHRECGFMLDARHRAGSMTASTAAGNNRQRFDQAKDRRCRRQRPRCPSTVSIGGTRRSENRVPKARCRGRSA